MDWIPIIFGLLGVGFVVLVVMAIRRMATARKARFDETPDEAQAAQETQEAFEDEEEDGPGPARAKKPRRQPRAPGKEVAKEPAAAQVDRAEEKQRLTRGLARTRGGFIARLGKLFSGKVTLDEETLEQVEEILFSADIGVRTSQELIDSLRKKLGSGQVNDPAAIWQHIRRRSAEILTSQGEEPFAVGPERPFVILVIGVNGTGKTTTIGKLAARLKRDGHSVLLAAGDTFRAAAVEQLEVWGGRAGCEVIKGKPEADPSSVVVDALKRAEADGVDVVIADTAGRLHTKQDLMDELKKVGRSISRHVEGAPHETLLVLDATTGQNAIAQARLFKEVMDVTGLVLTKLDGTAKGGVVLGIANELKLPVRFIGIGEKQEDLRPFSPEAFVEALYMGAEDGENGKGSGAVPE